MAGLLQHVDPDGLLEYSVVYTDRAVNHMSAQFQQAMRDISGTLRSVYNADAAVIVPGSGTFAMEAVARQFATDQHCLVVRNGWFSYRWSQILDAGNIPARSSVLKAGVLADEPCSPFAPAAIDKVLEKILEDKPGIVFAPHVETSSGIILPDDYLRRIGSAVRTYGGLFAVDCIASGAVWLDMKDCEIDVLISAPQKGWSGSPCCGLVMMSERAVGRMKTTASTSFSCDLGKWHSIMQAYEQGGHAYHATMPTDSLIVFRDVMQEAKNIGFDTLREAQIELGEKVRKMLTRHGFLSVAAPGYEAPGVVVCFTSDASIHSGAGFASQGVQIAAGVPLQCEERDDFCTFRVGLFGLDKLQNVGRTVSTLEDAVKIVVGSDS